MSVGKSDFFSKKMRQFAKTVPEVYIVQAFQWINLVS